MRKMLSALLVLVMLAVMLPVTALGADAVKPVEVTVSLTGSGVTLCLVAQEETSSGTLALSFDKEALKLADCKVEGDVTLVTETDTGLTLAYAADHETAVAAGETIATVELAWAAEAPARLTVTLEDFNNREGLHLVLAVLNLDPSLPFTDVAKNQWFYDAVKYTYDRGWFTGMTETRFQPQGKLTRAMFVTLLGRMAGVEAEARWETSFVDVKQGAYYGPYVAWAQENGIVEGTSQTTFSPNAEVTREQMATFLYRYAKFMGKDVTVSGSPLSDFQDADVISAYAVDAMAWAASRGILIGTGKGLEPKGVATRAQGAQILMNYDLYA